MRLVHPARSGLVFLAMLWLGGPWAALGDVVRDGSIGPGVDVQPEGPHYAIPADWGESADSSLFHSFSELSLSSDQSVTFTGFQEAGDPPAIDNIFARVTEVPSYIDGLVASEVEGASLFIVNQHGLMFGPNARLDLSGSFYGSTAHYLRFGEGPTSVIFETGLTLSPTLSVEPIAAFGFFENPAPIDVDGSLLAVGAGQSIALVGGDFTVTAEKHPDEPGQEDSTLMAPGGTIFLASTASAGEFVSQAGGDPLDASSIDTLGDIHFTGIGDGMDGDAIANVVGDPSGSIYIRGGNFVMEAASALLATNESDVDHAGTAVDIRLRGDMEMRDFAEIGASTAGLGRAGNVWIEARRLLMHSEVNIGSRSFGKVVDGVVVGGGDGGAIDLWAETLEMSRGAGVETTTFSQGIAGAINLHVGHLSLDGSEGVAIISSSADTRPDGLLFDGNGPAGAVNVWAETMDLVGGSHGFTGITSQVSTGAAGNPNAGILSIHTETLELRDSAQISTSVFHGAGSGGLIDIDANVIRLNGYQCRGGECTPATLFPSAIAAGVQEPKGSLLTVTGTAGTIRIVADLLEISDGAEISSVASSFSGGTAGETILDVGTLRLANSGSIRTDSFGSGAGGDIQITANDILIAGPSSAPAFAGTGIFAQAGTIATGSGSIEIHANTLDLADGGSISTSTFGHEQAGQVEVFAAESVHVHGVEAAVGPSQISSSSSIFIPALAGGDGGNVFVATPFLHIDDGGALSVSSETIGNAGDLVTRTTDTLLTNGALISALNTSSGDAGNLHLAATRDFEMRDSTISTVAAEAKGGNIKLDVGGQLVAQDSTISSAVGSGTGDGGNVDIDPRLVVLNRSGLSASAVGGDGGRIEITADQFLASATSTLNVTSTLGIEGEVVINAAESNLVEQITPLPEEFLDAPSLLRSRCGAQSDRQRGSFVVGGRDGAPASPDGFLSAPPEPQVPGTSAPGSTFDFDGLGLKPSTLDSVCTS